MSSILPSTDIVLSPPDIDTIEPYYYGISGELYKSTIYTFVFFDIASKYPLSKKWSAVHKNLDDLYECFDCHAPGTFSLHHTLCSMKLHSEFRSYNDVDAAHAARCICVDLDASVEWAQIEEWTSLYDDMTMVVETSPGRYHLYWRLAGTPRVNLDKWEMLQAAFAQHFKEWKADKSLANRAKCIRVPGIMRVTKSGDFFMPRIVWWQDTVWKEGDSRYDWIQPEYTEYLRLRKIVAVATAANAQQYKSIGTFSAPTVQHVLDISGRNNYLYRALKEFVMSGGSEEEARVLATKINEEFPMEVGGKLAGDEVGDCVASACKRGMLARPLEHIDLAPVVISANGFHPLVGVARELMDYTPGSFQYDYNTPMLRSHKFLDTTIASRMLQRYEQDLVKVATRLFAFSDGIWSVQKHNDYSVLHEMATKCALDTIHDPHFEKEQCSVTKHDKEAGTFTTSVSSSLRAKRQEHFMRPYLIKSSALSILNSSSVYKMRFDQFDAIPHYIVCDGVLVDMSKNPPECRAPKNTDYLLSSTHVRYDENADCPGFKQLLAELFPDNLELVPFMQRLGGYTLSGELSEQKIFLHSGDGGNGKSKVLYSYEYIMGAYAQNLPGSDFIENKWGDGKELERIGVQLEGKRVGLIDEIKPNSTWNEELIKKLTESSIHARKLHEERVDVVNKAKLHFNVNGPPKAKTENRGILRRLCLIPYNQMFPDMPAKETALRKMIRDEASGILRFYIEGFYLWQEEGKLMLPKCIADLKTVYVRDTFKVETLLKDMFERPSSEIATELYHLCDLIEEIKLFSDDKELKAAITEKSLRRDLRRVLQPTFVDRAWHSKKKNSYCAVYLRKKYDAKNLKMCSDPSNILFDSE